MKVFITGAAGSLGSSAAAAFRRAGHEVWGLVRSAEKGRALAREEVHPVLGDLEKPESYSAAAESCSVLVHAAAVYGSGAYAFDRKAIDGLLEAGRRGPRPKTLIYTSGTWVYGNTGARLVDETAPPSPAPHVAERPRSEQMVLGAAGVRGLVLRPGCVYGRQGSLTALWFESAVRQQTLAVVGDGGNRWACVHLDDLGEAYVRAAESGLGGEIFNVTDRSRSTVLEMAAAVARVTGFAGTIATVPVAEAAGRMGTLAECLALDQHVDARKAVRLLGWQPRHGGFADEAGECFEAWKAWQS
ncbi:MAG TPA: NAD-dependent epimerase/dehydratase family protein [Thermoanaerobaculia bacterium]|jgi:nucleoside-diphosphate-sugar epimerase